jgi:Tfp pilus assembly protein FimV
MVAVAQAPSCEPRRLVVVRTAPAPGRPRSRVPVTTFRRRQAAAALLVVSMLVAFLLALQGLVVSAARPSTTPPARPPDRPGPVHVVQPGDTFWGIARALRPNDDPRPLVARLVAAHGSPDLVVGERVRLPAGA